MVTERISRRVVKQTLVDAFGGKCIKCGYARCLEALAFHHKDPSQKKFTISQALAVWKRWDVLIEEAKKCVLLCSNCHLELHAGNWTLDEIGIVVPVLKSRKYKRDVIKGTCLYCAMALKNRNAYCSPRCASLARSKIKWPDDELQSMVEASSVAAVARQLGVSWNAVSQRLRDYCGNPRKINSR